MEVNWSVLFRSIIHSLGRNAWNGRLDSEEIIRRLSHSQGGNGTIDSAENGEEEAENEGSELSVTNSPGPDSEEEANDEQ